MSKASRCWWVQGWSDPNTILGITEKGYADWDIREMPHDDYVGWGKQRKRDFWDPLFSGQPVDPKNVPADYQWSRATTKQMNSVTPFVHAGGLPAVTEEMKEFLEGFDLGDTRFHKVRLLNKHATEEAPPGKLYILNVCNRVYALLPRESLYEPGKTVSGIRNPGFDIDDVRDLMFSTTSVLDDAIVLTDAALDAPDLWMDPRFTRGLFMSDRLAKAIKKARLGRNWRLKRCRVVSRH